MPHIGASSADVAVDFWQPANLILSLSSLVCMVTVVTLCTCCVKKGKNRDPNEVYGVINPAAVAISNAESNPPVQFRSSAGKLKPSERHSQPASKHSNGTTSGSIRASAPGRALPQVPGDLYSSIDKTRKEDIRFVDDMFNPTYESIDPDQDSFADPLYSKVGDPGPSTRRERKYDYPVFKKSDPHNATTRSDEAFYQSASQIYTAGSEDPYSSIASDSRNAGDGDNSSAYEPGYAKVKGNATDRSGRRLDHIEQTERELDQLYSKIRRNSRDYEAGPSTAVIDEIDAPEPLPAAVVVDNQSVASRDPSYRYITVRENAEAVRERLRQQGQLGPPVREHYYSTIGNEYETLGDNSSTYSQVRSTNREQSVPSNVLHVNTGIEYVPPPPTSPIPDRTPAQTTTYRQSSYTDSLERVEPVAGAMYTVLNKRGTSNEPNGTISRNSVGRGNVMTKSLPSDGFSTDSKQNGQSSFVNHQEASSQATVRNIQEFLHRPSLPYGSSETILGRRLTEERELIVEQRHTTNASDLLNGPTTSSNTSRSTVFHVPITRSSSGFEGPRADDIISGRRYRSSNTYQNGIGPAQDLENSGQDQDIMIASGSSKNSSRRTGLPIAMNDSEIREKGERSRQRRQESLEREKTDELSGSTSALLTNRNRSRSPRGKPWKTETEEEKIQRLGTIYTANDYVSTIDMGTERPWPMLVGSSSPPSLRDQQMEKNSTAMIHQPQAQRSTEKM